MMPSRLGEIRVDGALVFWTLGEWTSRDAIEAGWGLLPPPPGGGTWAEWAPPPRTHEACLKDAMALVWPKHLIRPLAKRDGFAVLEEQRLHDDVYTITRAVAKVDDLGRVELVRGQDLGQDAALRAEFRRQSGLLKPSQVTSGLVAVLSRLAVAFIRPTGGLYWLPERSLSAWEGLAGVVEKASVGGRSVIYTIRHRFDADSIRAVRDALLKEVEDEVEGIIREVDSGDLGEVALGNRAAKAEALQAKVRQYEMILGERLDDARGLAEKAEMSATAAKILAVAAL